MNAKILILALCAFQLASGQDISSMANTFVTTAILPSINTLTSTLSSGQQTLASATQQLTSAFNNAVQQVPSFIQTSANAVQQFANSVNSTSAQVQAQVQNCVAQANQSLSGLQKNLTTQLQSQAASANASIQNATTSLGNANSAYQNALNTAASNYTNCVLKDGIFLILIRGPICSAQLATTAVSSISSAITAAFQPFLKLFGLSVNSATESVIPLVSSAAEQIQQTFQNSANQAATFVNQTATCISQAVNSAAAGANATITSG